MTATPQTNTREPTAAQLSDPANGKRGAGAPRGNRNAIRHGLRGDGFPEGCRKIETRMNQFRRTVEDCVIAVRGEITIVDACLVSTAYKWERHGALDARWLRLHGGKMNHSERLNYSREVARAASERDKAIAGLKLDVDRNGFDSLWNATLPAPGRPGDPLAASDDQSDQKSAGDATDAAEATAGGQGGDGNGNGAGGDGAGHDANVTQAELTTDQ